MRFLNSMAPNWNISLFPLSQSWRRLWSYPSWLAGAEEEMKAFKEFLNGLGYRYWDERKPRV